MKLSVIIPVYNSPELAFAHVRYCLQSERRPDEIIVVDDASKERLADTLRLMPAPLMGDCRIVCARVNKDIQWNQAGAKNLGIWLSRGDILAFEDVEHVPEPWLYLKALRVFEANAAVGRVAVPRCMVKKAELLTAEGPKRKHDHTPAPGVWLARREVITAAGGYDEDFAGQYGYEDTLILSRFFDLHVKVATLAPKDGRYMVPANCHTPGMDRSTQRNSELLLKKRWQKKWGGPVLRFPFEVETING